MTPVEQQQVVKIEADHQPRWVRTGLLRWRRRCVLDGQTHPCNRRQHARDIRDGRRDISGRPR